MDSIRKFYHDIIKVWANEIRLIFKDKGILIFLFVFRFFPFNVKGRFLVQVQDLLRGFLGDLNRGRVRDCALGPVPVPVNGPRFIGDNIVNQFGMFHFPD